MRILALDVGTSSVKAAILDAVTALPMGPVAHVAYPLDHPTPDAAEVAPEHLWSAGPRAAGRATAGAAGLEGAASPCRPPPLVLLDQADRPLPPIGPPPDRRARPAARRVWAEAGEEFLHTTGNRPLPG